MSMDGPSMATRILSQLVTAGVIEEHTEESRQFWNAVSQAIVAYLKENAEIIVNGECTIRAGVSVDVGSISGEITDLANPTQVTVTVDGPTETDEEAVGVTVGIGTLD